jgi:hypothetical protein
MKKGKWIGVLLVAAVMPASGVAGEFQFGGRLGGGNLQIDPERVRDGDGISANGLSAGLAIGYRTDPGLLFELGIVGLLNVDGEILSGAVQKSLAVGWQVDRDKWRFTPKAGFLHSYLDAADGRNLVEDGRPSERFTDTVPFIEGSLDYRLFPAFSLGLFARHVFEDFGDSQAWGLTFTFNVN